MEQDIENKDIENMEIPVSLPTKTTSDRKVSKKKDPLADLVRSFQTKGYNNNQIAALMNINREKVDSYDI